MHEHWNNATDKQYSRNLGTGQGIELVALTLSSSPPAPPAAATATGVTGDGFTANWNAAAGASGYRLDISTSGTFSDYVTGYQDLDVGAATSRTVTNLGAGTYHFRVRAYNAYGSSGNSATVSVTVTLILCTPATLLNGASRAQPIHLTNDRVSYRRGTVLPTTTWSLDKRHPAARRGRMVSADPHTSSR